MATIKWAIDPTHSEVLFKVKHLLISKVSGQFKPFTEDDKYKLYGTLTIRRISQPAILDVEFGGITKDPWGFTRVGFEVTGRISRKDFGVSFTMVSETGGLLLGDEVAIHAQTELYNSPRCDC